MSDLERRFHETWLGMVQPTDGLVVSIPVLVDAQCMDRQTPEMQRQLGELCPATREGENGPEGFQIADLRRFLGAMLGYADDAFDAFDAFDSTNPAPDTLSLWVPEGRQTLAPTLALKKVGERAAASAQDTPAAQYEMLVWDVPPGLSLDKPETLTGPWDYPPQAKFDRLLRHARVPIGVLTNREVVRLCYAPHGESSGSITFRVEDMLSVGGRPILDAFVMLLSANRLFGVTEERALPALLAESRKRQANVTNDLAEQVLDALTILLRGFEAASERDGKDLLDDALARENDHLTKGLLTVLLRLVFLLYAEDRGLLPVDRALYAQHLSVLSLFDELQAAQGAYPDSMSRRFGAWGRLVTVFRAVFLGVSHGDLSMPPRHGSLFNPHTYPFLEGWGPGGSAPITQAEDRAAVRLPSVSDETVFRVLEKLLIFEGQRLSYRALDVEQIGSVYEALMGYHAQRVAAPSVCMRPNRLWLSAEEVLEVPSARRAKWIKETVGLPTAQAEKLAKEIAEDESGALTALGKYAATAKKADPALAKARAGQLVLQPGSERRRTSSHYTPRSLSEPIVRRTLEPLLAVMGEAPASERILHLKVCDPAMGSGAFLVEACRFLGDQVLAAWTREGKIDALAKEHGDLVLHARRVVAQRCLYGVDKNDAAVELAKLSLWLVTLSKDLPFTFLDHSLRHGDSLVGLDFEQIRAFHWKRPETGTEDPKDTKPKKQAKRAKGVAAPGQLALFGSEIDLALEEAILLRQKIGELGDSPTDDDEKARLFWDAQDALDRVRLIGDVIVGAFFAHDKDKAREEERRKREDMVRAWLASGGPPTEELATMQREIRARLPVFHWMVEYPEVFYAERPDPLDGEQVNRAAYMDAFVGNPPFAGKNGITEANGASYLQWLLEAHEGAHGNADLSAHFFRRAAHLLGSHGTVGLVATNTIAQGDTRQTGLAKMIERGWIIYDATVSMPWPGDAGVVVSVINLARGIAAHGVGERRLNHLPVQSISSQLQPSAERTGPSSLYSNAHLAFVGSYVLGMGFTLTSEEREDLITKDPRNAERIFPYLGGQDVNTSATQQFQRYVIDFQQTDLDSANKWPFLVERLRERVKPERDKLKNNTDGRDYKLRWWQFAKVRTGLYEAIAPLSRCLVASRVTKHLSFCFQPTNLVFADSLYVFPLPLYSAFAALQSRIHAAWTVLLSSSMGRDNQLRYAASDCFETFAFPTPDPRTAIPALEDIGWRLYRFRANYMTDENVGLTTTYNRLKDATCTEPRMVELRGLHEAMDLAVVTAYAKGDPRGNWQTLRVPPFCPATDEDKANLAAFEEGVIDRLFALNARRVAEEAAAASRPATGVDVRRRSPRGKAPGRPTLPVDEPVDEV